MRLFTTSRTLAGFATSAPRSAALSTASSLRQPRARRTTARHGASRAGTAPSAGRLASHASTLTAPLAGAQLPAMAANDSSYDAVTLDDKVRILRSDANDHARMVLSGRMADVCAALEKMS